MDPEERRRGKPALDCLHWLDVRVALLAGGPDQAVVTFRLDVVDIISIQEYCPAWFASGGKPPKIRSHHTGLAQIGSSRLAKRWIILIGELVTRRFLAQRPKVGEERRWGSKQGWGLTFASLQ